MRINGKYTTIRNSESGYTLMELLVVLAILGLLTAIATPFALHYLETAKVKAAKTEVANIRTANAEQRTLRHRERELAQGERVLHGQQVEHLRNEVARLRTDVVETLRGASDIEQREQVGDGLNLLRAIAEELKARRY